MSIKPKRKQNLSTSLVELQKDKEEIERCQQSPAYFYNRYIRREGEKVLSEEEYREYVLKAGELREKKGEFAKIKPTYYPLTPEEAIKLEKDATTGE